MQITSDCELYIHMEHHRKWYGKNMSTRRREECRGMLTSTAAHISSQRLLRKRESFLFESVVFGRLTQ